MRLMDGQNLGKDLFIAEFRRHRFDGQIGITPARDFDNVPLQLIQLSRVQQVGHGKIAVVHIEFDLLLFHHSGNFDSFAHLLLFQSAVESV